MKLPHPGDLRKVISGKEVPNACNEVQDNKKLKNGLEELVKLPDPFPNPGFDINEVEIGQDREELGNNEEREKVSVTKFLLNAEKGIEQGARGNEISETIGVNVMGNNFFAREDNKPKLSESNIEIRKDFEEICCRQEKNKPFVELFF